MKFIKLTVFLVGCVSLVACSGFEPGVEGTQETQSTSSTGNLGSFQASLSPVHNLGTSQTYQVSFNNSTNYSGQIQFTVDRSSIVMTPGQQDILIDVSPTQANVTPGSQVDLTVTVNAPYRSPSFSNRQIGLVVTGNGGEQSTLSFPLTIRPVVDIELRECAYQNNATLDDCWNAPASMDIRPHSAGVTLRFTNCDPTSDHIVHGNGLVRHQPTNQPLPQANSATNCAGSYTVQVAATDTGNGSYYMHDTQGGGQARQINFGVTNPMSAKAASVADDFDRGPSNAGSCHDPVGTN